MRKYTNLIKFDENGYPLCEEHGAMLCVNEQGSLWRCPTCHIGVSFEHIRGFEEWIRLQKNRTELGLVRVKLEPPFSEGSLIEVQVIIVADDFKGYGKESDKKSKYVGQKGKIVGWHSWKHGRKPVIELDSGEVISRNSIWWSKK